MNIDKQIDEMRFDIADIDGTNGIHIIGYVPLASALCKLGYCKASEVAREIFEEIEENILGSHYLKSYEWNAEAYEELKKKYTEGEEKKDCSNCRHRNAQGCPFGNMCIASTYGNTTPSHWQQKESEDTE